MAGASGKALPGVRPGPSHVRRIGHLVLESADPASVYRWYHEHFGLRKADEVRLPNGSGTADALRQPRSGREFVDHHVVGFQFALDEGARVQHIAFEVGNFDDLMAGHEHLKSKGRKSVWGVGRHRYGGQIYDYWANPWGVIHEHWTDTDLVNEDTVPTDCDFAGPRGVLGSAAVPLVRGRSLELEGGPEPGGPAARAVSGARDGAGGGLRWP